MHVWQVACVRRDYLSERTPERRRRKGGSDVSLGGRRRLRGFRCARLRRLCGFGSDLALFRRLQAVFLGESFDATFGVDEFLAAGEERVASRADL